MALEDEFEFVVEEDAERGSEADEGAPAPADVMFPEAVLPYYDGPLPEEVVKIWCGRREDELSARILIAGWGVERFLGSRVHEVAKSEATREARMAPVRQAYLKAVARL